ncbi:MAG: hypothetical protein K6E83_09505, partial [Clostridium sp.]|nr:hypothetical protein [Clostridium sp.]
RDEHIGCSFQLQFKAMGPDFPEILLHCFHSFPGRSSRTAAVSASREEITLKCRRCRETRHLLFQTLNRLKNRFQIYAAD